jgi:hypothetical protein
MYNVHWACEVWKDITNGKRTEAPFVSPTSFVPEDVELYAGVQNTSETRDSSSYSTRYYVPRRLSMSFSKIILPST